VVHTVAGFTGSSLEAQQLVTGAHQRGGQLVSAVFECAGLRVGTEPPLLRGERTPQLGQVRGRGGMLHGRRTQGVREVGIEWPPRMTDFAGGETIESGQRDRACCHRQAPAFVEIRNSPPVTLEQAVESRAPLSEFPAFRSECRFAGSESRPGATPSDTSTRNQYSGIDHFESPDGKEPQ
jgi:hypothetical protein